MSNKAPFCAFLWLTITVLSRQIRSLPAYQVSLWSLPTYKVGPRNLFTPLETCFLFLMGRNPLLINNLRLRKITYEKIKLFLQNEPKFRKSQMNLNNVLTSNYVQMDTWSIRKNKAKTNPIQSQFKANSNPIQSQFKAKQTQFKPKQTQFYTHPARIHPENQLPNDSGFSMPCSRIFHAPDKKGIFWRKCTMKRLFFWLIVAIAGLVLMIFSYYHYQDDPFDNTWEYAFMYIGSGEPEGGIEGLEYDQRPARLLPLTGRAQNFTQIAKGFGSKVEWAYRIAYREKVILCPDIANDFTTDMLEWGQLPAGGTGEVLAGYTAKHTDQITVEGRTLKVTGQLKKGIGLFANSYLIGEGSAAKELFGDGQSAYILRLPKEKVTDSEFQKQIRKVFPGPKFTAYAPLIRTQPEPFYIYLAGMALLLLGGCLALFTLYCILADRIRNKWLRLPLAEIRKYKYLFIAMNLIYFGTVLLFMLVSYVIPEVQSCFLVGVASQITEGSGPLAIAGKAYASKNILLAAVTTFAINFPFGSLVLITLPSIIVPGAGVLVAGLRSALWGFILAPSFSALSGMMVPHSVTLLLEGHGYVIASFFGILVLVYLCRKSEGPNVGVRYGRALLMNVRGNLLVIIVLAVAAIYEAVEVILMMNRTGR